MVLCADAAERHAMTEAIEALRRGFREAAQTLNLTSQTLSTFLIQGFQLSISGLSVGFFGISLCSYTMCWVFHKPQNLQTTWLQIRNRMRVCKGGLTAMP